MAHVIVSYDGTRNDRDALALGRVFAAAGAQLTLAYVRHARAADPQQESAEQEQAERLLEVGASLVDGTTVSQRVVLSPSTADGLASLASEAGAQVIAFGSSYRTPDGHVEVPQTAEQLIEGEVACSIALAPAGLRREPVEHSIGTVAVLGEGDGPSAEATAASLAHALGATVTGGDADLLVLGSRAGTPPGRLGVSATARERAEQARCPVLLLAEGAALSFP